MNKLILTLLYFFKLSLLVASPIYYRPMSKRSIDFGDDVCYYEDISNDFKLMYVKGCPSGKSCQQVETDTEQYKIHTCQTFYSDLKRNPGENCDEGLYECKLDVPCSSGKCSGSSPTPTPDTCTTIKEIGSGDCITAQAEIAGIGNKCYIQETSTSTPKNYLHYTSSKQCKKLNIKEKEDLAGQYYIQSKELVDYYSIEDGDYVEYVEREEDHNKFCQSGFSLFFFGNGKLISSDTGMFKRCVTFLAIESSSTNYIIKYKIKNGEEHIYDTSHLTGTFQTNQNDELANLLAKLEILNYMKEEYKTNGENSNGLIKWEYLYRNPKDYLLYKDQVDVLDYLVQKYKNSYIPERYAIHTEPNTQDTNTTEQTDSTTQNETGSSRLLNIKYIFMLLILFLL